MMRYYRTSAARCFIRSLAVAITLLCTAAATSAAPRVQFELITAQGFPITGAQKWVQSLSGLENISIQIRSGRDGEKISVENLGTEAAPQYHVIGILDAGNRLILPGGTFRMGERDKIAAWLEKLRVGGEAAPTERTSVFGLTAKELLALNETLSRKVASSTAGRRAGDVARELTQTLAIEISVDPSARTALAGPETVAEELEGLTTGTALAAVLRPLGLVLTAERTPARATRLVILDSRRAKDFWPIGWPPQQPAGELAPDLFKYLNVEIDDTPLEDAIGAVQGRVKLPFLFDHNAMARHRIDVSQVNVNLPETRLYYKQILDRLLNQAQLTSEVRVDEAGQPFLWISTRLK